MSRPTTKRPYNTNTKRRSVRLNDDDWQKLKSAGNGNASQGIRELIKSKGAANER